MLASAIEHISVINPMKELQKSGYSFSQVPVDGQGRLVRGGEGGEGIGDSVALEQQGPGRSEVLGLEPAPPTAFERMWPWLIVGGGILGAMWLLRR